MSGKGQRLYLRAKKIIPGGTQLLSKRPELYLPDLWPAYYSRARGAYVWDLDHKRHLDMSMHGIGACILGYADPDVNRAAFDAIRRGSLSILNCPEEVALAELLCELHPWAEMARFARSGGEALAVAIRIARAASNRENVIFCGYHGWHDWYLSANLADNRNLDGQLLPGLEPKGVPRELRGTTAPFHYSSRKEFDAQIKHFGRRLGVIVMEPARNADPDIAFLRYVREKAAQLGAVLIFDEVTSGWRQTLGGIHLKTGVKPDMAVFAKGLSNGFPMAAIIGKKNVMQAAQKTFISSTYWTERVGPSAALATIHKLKKYNVSAHLNAIGQRMQEGWSHLAQKNHLPIHVHGIYPLSHFAFDGEQAMVMKTLFTQLMLEKGFLASTAFYASWAHTPRMIDQYLRAADGAFLKIRLAQQKNSLKALLKGPVAQSGFTRLT